MKRRRRGWLHLGNNRVNSGPPFQNISLCGKRSKAPKEAEAARFPLQHFDCSQCASSLVPIAPFTLSILFCNAERKRAEQPGLAIKQFNLEHAGILSSTHLNALHSEQGA